MLPDHVRRVAGVLPLATLVSLAAGESRAQSREQAPAAASEGAPAPPPSAEAEVMRQCLDGHARGQVLRRSAKLLEAASALQRCAQLDCPDDVRQDCADWFVEVRQSTPSIIVNVQPDESKRDAKLYVDGQLVISDWGNTPVPLDPGSRRLRVVLPGHGEALPCNDDSPSCREQVISLSTGAVATHVFDFESVPRSASPVSAPAPAPALDTERARPIPAYTYVLAGTALAAAAAGTVLLVLANDAKADKEASCAPFCSEDQVDEVERGYRLATGGYALAGGAALAAVLTFLLRPEVSSPRQAKARTTPKLRFTGASPSTIGVGGVF